MDKKCRCIFKKKLQDEVRSGFKGEKYDGSSGNGYKLIMHYICLNLLFFFVVTYVYVKEGVHVLQNMFLISRYADFFFGVPGKPFNLPLIQFF